MPKGLSSRSQRMVNSAVSFFNMEKDNGGPFMDVNDVKQRASFALGVSLSTVNRICAKSARGEGPSTPKKSTGRRKSITIPDDFDICSIRNVIYDMYANREHITISLLLEKLKAMGIWNGERTSLWRTLKAIGFKYQKDDPRRGLMELPHIALKRICFLQRYLMLKELNLYNFVFLDETWIFQDGSVGWSWQDHTKETVKKTKVGGTRFIILHAGGAGGFIHGCELVFASKANTSDYHGEMNHDTFMNWWEHQLLPNLDGPTVIVMDNASYHSHISNKAPNSATKKRDVQLWLDEHNVAYTEIMLKPQLLQLVKMNKPEPIYVVDELAEQHGHIVLRLPPYHCIFNPIELVWGMAKTHYNKYVGQGGRSVELSVETWKEALRTVTPEKWANTVEHTDKIIRDWYDRDVHIEKMDITPIIINVNAESSDTSSSEDFE